MLIKYHAVGLLAVAIITHAMHAAAQVPGYPDGIREASYRSDDEQNEPQSSATGNSIHHASLDPL